MSGSPVVFIFYFVILPAPLWVPAVLLYCPPKVTSFLFKLSIVACVCAFVFAMSHAADRDPWQWAGVFTLMGAFWTMLSIGLGLGVTRNRARQQPDTELSASFQTVAIQWTRANARRWIVILSVLWLTAILSMQLSYSHFPKSFVEPQKISWGSALLLASITLFLVIPLAVILLLFCIVAWRSLGIGYKVVALTPVLLISLIWLYEVLMHGM